MGIGRFAFTPLLPMMLTERSVTFSQGAWLAAANYVGYLIGAVASFQLMPRPETALRFALVSVALATVAMAATDSYWVWIGLRCAAGVASAFALVGASAWTLGRLSALQPSDLSGWVFAGVGVGLVFAGVVTIAAVATGYRASAAWTLLGCSAAVVAAFVWPALGTRVSSATSSASSAVPARLGVVEWSLILCYGIFGLGYIIPATFIPAIARTLVDDPRIFGLAWPLFGVAAAASTVFVTRYLHRTPPRTVAIWSLLMMAVGVALPALVTNISAIAISALCVGGTFMVMTMAGFQEARRISPGSPARLIAIMTAAFALGQLVGPILVGVDAARAEAVVLPSLIAAGGLVAAAATLAFGPGKPRNEFGD